MSTAINVLDLQTINRYLAEGGLSDAAVVRLAPRFVRQAEALRARGAEAGADVCAFFVPGRIEVLGKHTDYAGGSSLTCAVERGFAVVAVPEPEDDDHALHVVDTAAGTSAVFELDANGDGRPGDGRPDQGSAYVATVVRRMSRNFPGALRGGRVAFSSDLPPAAGMSSSSALVAAFFLVLRALGEVAAHPAYRAHLRSREALAHYLGCIENGQTFGALRGDAGVGTFGGSEDHTAILCSRPGALRRYAYAPTRPERTVQLPPGLAFVIGASGVVAEKTGAARARYNRAARLATGVAEAWRAFTGRDDPHLGGAVAGPAFTPKAMKQAIEAYDGGAAAEDLTRRFAQFYLENHLILPAATDALEAGNLAGFGRLVDRSQRCAERLLGNQVEETIFLAREARRLGAVAASAFGAGFGGSVWALVWAEEAEAFAAAWSDRYAEAFPERAAHALFLTDRPGPAAFRLGAGGPAPTGQTGASATS